MAAEDQIPDITLDPDNLYREETISDGQAGTVRRMVPVTVDGDPDEARPVRYEGYASLVTPAGNLPIHFELPVDSLREALAQFPEAAKAAIERTMAELQELRQQQQQQQSGSGLYVPGQGDQPSGGGMGGGMDFR